MADHPGSLELMLLLAVLRLGEDKAYGVPISTEIEQTTGRRVALASVYAALERMEERGWVASRVGESTLPCDDGGRPSGARDKGLPREDVEGHS
jgi:DNA-binding PadR family transcriptional regulator